MTRRWLLLVGVVVVAVVGVVVWVVVDDGDDEPSSPGGPGLDAPSVPSSVGEGLSAEAQELTDLLAGRADDTYHATYVAEGDPDALAGEITIDEWRAGDRLRRDTTIVADGARTAETRTIVDEGGVVSCTRLDGGEWTCEPGQVDEGEGDPLLGTVADQLAGVDVVETDTDEVDGRDARCFTFTSADGPGEVCTTPDGVPLRVAVGESVLRLTELTDDVPPGTFDPPAPVAGG